MPRSCPTCAALLAADQRYCLECGTRDGAPRLDWRAMVSPAAAVEHDASAAEETIGPQLRLPAPRTAAALVLGMLGFGVVVGASAGPGADAADAGGRRNVTILAAAAPPVLPAVAPVAPPEAPAAPAAPRDDTASPSTAPGDAVVPAPVDEPAAVAPADDAAPSQGAADDGATDAPAAAPAKLPPVSHVWVVDLPAGTAPDETLRARGTWLSWYRPLDGDLARDGVALLGGQKDTTGPFGADVPTLPGQLTDAGRTWKAYVEGATAGLQPGENPCARPAGEQPRNPFLRFASITGASECGSLLAEPGALAADVADPESAPSFSYISLAAADPATTLQPVLDSEAFAKGGLVVITSGEGALLLSPYVTAGATIGAPYDPFALLRSIEDLFSLEPLGYAKDTKLKPFGPKVYAAWALANPGRLRGGAAITQDLEV